MADGARAFALRLRVGLAAGDANLQVALLLVCALLLVRLEILLRRLLERLATAERALRGAAPAAGGGAGAGEARALAGFARTEEEEGEEGEGRDADDLAVRADAADSRAPADGADLLAGPVPVRLIRLPELTRAQRAAADELAERAGALECVVDSPALCAFLKEPTTAPRYVLARVGASGEPDVRASLAMLEECLRWRRGAAPDAPPSAALRAKAATGGVYVGGLDQHGRPVIVFDNDKVTHVGTVAQQLSNLAFHLEYASALLRARPAAVNGVARFVIFIKLTDYKLSTSPPLRVTLGTVRLLLNCHPERLGQCILFQPPRAFGALFSAASAILPAATLAKVVFVSGGCADGSANDALLAAVIGPRWRELTGAERPVLAPGCSPGFHIDAYWPMVERDYELLARGEPPVGPDWPQRAPAGAPGAGAAGGRAALSERAPEPSAG